MAKVSVTRQIEYLTKDIGDHHVFLFSEEPRRLLRLKTEPCWFTRDKNETAKLKVICEATIEIHPRPMVAGLPDIMVEGFLNDEGKFERPFVAFAPRLDRTGIEGLSESDVVAAVEVSLASTMRRMV